jgi:hypothetical protein
MFFLYGVGNGRIARGRLRDSLYWLRFHAVLFISIIAGFLFPWFFLISVGITLYLYMILVQPALSAIRSQTNDLTREFFVPLIVLIRSFATHAGFLVGTWDFHRNPIYREKLNAYQKPRNARTESASSVT